MSRLFEPIQAGALRLRNRIVMAPLTRNRARGNAPNALMEQYYAQRATAGLIISEGVAISPQAHGYADVPGIYTPEQIAGWRRITDSVHRLGGCIVAQLWHVGRVSHTALLPAAQVPVGPSAIKANAKTYLIKPDGMGGFEPVSEPRALEAAELPGIVDEFRSAAAAAVHAGFDGIEVHGANGYLIDQFLKTGANQRSDAYGGAIENRARLLLEVMRAIAGEIGAPRTGLRLSPVTPANDIVDADPQALFEYLVRQLAALDLAYLHVIEGATGGARELSERPFDYKAMRQAWRSAGARGAWMVNNGYDRALAEHALAHGADLVAFGKAFIANPDLVERLRRDALLNTPDRKTFYGGDAHGYTDYPTLA